MLPSLNTPVIFDASVRTLLDGRNFAGVATLGPDGAPQNSVVWIKREGDTVLSSSTDGRHKVRNLRRDPRVSLTCLRPGQPLPLGRDPRHRRDPPGRGRLPHELATNTSASTRPRRRTTRSV